MTEQELRALARDCYAAFNQSEPAPSSRAWPMWAEICREVPFAASAWIRGKIIEMDAMPRNFGKAVKTLHREWRAEHCRTNAGRPCCPDCDHDLPGFFHWWREEASGALYSGIFRCLCNNNAEFDPMRRKSKAQATQEGFATIPQGFKGGPADFEKTRFPSARAKETTRFAQTAGRLARAPAAPEPPRPAHAELLAGRFSE